MDTAPTKTEESRRIQQSDVPPGTIKSRHLEQGIELNSPILATPTLTSPTITSGTITDAILNDPTFVISGVTKVFSSYSDSRIKIVASTKNIADASGNQTITGVGFTPVAVIALSVVDASTKFSIGFDDGTTPKSVIRTGATNYTYFSYLIAFDDGSGNTMFGKVSSFNSDGCVIAWAKTNSPTGTAQEFFLFFR